jgi:uncharacterized membrane protein
VTAVAARVRALRLDDLLAAPFAVPFALAALSALSVYVRSRQLHAGFWIDEGLSVGIAHHPWSSLLHVLRHDGSPPAYYLLLRAWIAWFGDGERATHSLSLVFGVACVPLAYLLGRAAFDRTTGLCCALLAALNPYLTYYAQETRMYELEAFLSIVVTFAYVEAIVRGRRAYAPLLVGGLALMLYTHNWALFLCVGLAVATFVVARERLKAFAVAGAASSRSATRVRRGRRCRRGATSSSLRTPCWRATGRSWRWCSRAGSGSVRSSAAVRAPSARWCSRWRGPQA